MVKQDYHPHKSSIQRRLDRLAKNLGIVIIVGYDSSCKRFSIEWCSKKYTWHRYIDEDLYMEKRYVAMGVLFKEIMSTIKEEDEFKDKDEDMLTDDIQDDMIARRNYVSVSPEGWGIVTV